MRAALFCASCLFIPLAGDLAWYTLNLSSERYIDMQTDAWLTDASNLDRCPLCSQPLAGGSNICSACGFAAHEPAPSSSPSGQERRPTGVSQEALARSEATLSGRNREASAARLPVSRQLNPITPIPARASAQRTQSRPGARSPRSRADAASAAQSSQQGAGWQHESSSYEAVSSLSSLSLIISETPTAPPRSPRSTGRLEKIDEIDTIPQTSGQTRALQRSSGQMRAAPLDLPETPLPPGSLSLRFDDLAVPNLAALLSESTPSPALAHIDEIDTVPEAGNSRSLVPLQPATREVAVDAASWTAGPGATSSLAARFVASRSPRRKHRRRLFNPLDRTRWWLLRPGRIEFMLWTLGSILLFGITFLILLATVLSLMLPGLQGSGNFPTSTVKASVASPVATSTASNELHLALSGKTSLVPGAEMHLQGQGFHPQSKIIFLLDGRLPLLDQHGKAASIQADPSGRFAVNLWLGQGTGWSAGSHQVFARDTTSGHQVAIAITISAVVVSNPGGVQSTPAPPVNPTPTPVLPTPTPVRPAPTPQPPAATPTPGITPTPTAPSTTPTGGVTVTPGTSGATVTPAQGAGSSSLGNALNNADGDSLFARLARLNPLVWLIGVCYFISMLLLGMAGLLRRQRRE